MCIGFAIQIVYWSVLNLIVLKRISVILYLLEYLCSLCVCDFTNVFVCVCVCVFTCQSNSLISCVYVYRKQVLPLIMYVGDGDWRSKIE